MSKDTAKWDDLRVFLEVARQGSVHAAAKRLKLDHSTVCRRVDKLESLLSVRLLDRTRKGIVVREEALNLLKHIEQMEAHAASLEDALARGSGDAAHIVRVATMEGIASRYIALRLSVLSHFAPNVKLELVSIAQAVDLSRKQADIFLSFFNPKAPGLQSTLFSAFKLHLYASPQYLQRHGTPKSRDDLRNHAFVGYIEDLLAIEAVKWLSDIISSPRMAFHSNSIIAQCGAAVSGLGIVLLPTFVANGVEGLQRVLPDQVSTSREVWVSVRTEQSYLTRIKDVVRFLKYVFEHDADFLNGRADKLPSLAPPA
jgi:DNA-binding transcriptional LysR family regulator